METFQIKTWCKLWSRPAKEADYLLKVSASIHPRVIGRRSLHEPSNTCGKKRPETIARKIASLTAHLERHPNDMSADGKLSKLQGR